MDKKKNLSREDSVIVIALHRIVAEMDRQTRLICKKYDLTLGQFSVLEALHSKGELSIGELKNLVLSTDGTIPVVIGNLEKMGFVIKNQDKADKRKFMVRLTEAGEELICKVYPENVEMITKKLSVLSAEDKTLSVELLKKYRAHI